MRVLPSGITAYFESLRRILDINPLALNYSVIRERISELAGFIQLEVVLIKGNHLAVFEYYEKDSGITTYRYHLMNRKKVLVVRWDNASHHPELGNFPHHRYTKDGVFPSPQPTLQQVLDLLVDYLE